MGVADALVPTLSVAGTWQNQHGSKLILSEHGDKLHGRYHTALGTPAFETPHMVFGCQRGVALAIIVDFGDAVTTWTGQLVQDELHLLWNLADEAPGDFPGACRSGFAVFQRV